MTTLHTYIPQDRLLALAYGETLPDRTSGSALFADISGFTALTESLRELLGPRRGAEELTRHLDAVYTGLIAEVEKYGGSVIDFAGDSITCWFDDAGARDQETGNTSAQAVSCAFALQEVMQAFKTIALPNGTTTMLALKVAVASGPARRFVVGDPNIHYMDTLAGATVTRTATAEHLSQRGNVLLDEATVNALGPSLTIREWRIDHDTHERFAVLEQGKGVAGAGSKNTDPQPPALDPNVLQPYIHPTVYERESSQAGSFLTEFRPCVVLFVRFIGIDYDSENAKQQLDSFIRSAQRIVERYEGISLQITIGDKGSYAYINFGALSTHEDDARRAVKVAIELRNMARQLDFLQPLQIGITQGTMRVGAYGGATRRTYGALGDDVNLAARLMTTAAVGEILISGQVHKAVRNDFTFEPRPPLPMKGKAEPLPVFAVTGERKQRAVRLQEPTYALPMVGRQSELKIIEEKLDLAANSQAQVIGIVAEAGMGKSRLVAEVIRSAHKKGFVGYGGACQSDGVNTPYLAWKSIWSAFFDVDPSAPLRKQIRDLESEIADHAPERAEALPLLGILLNLEIPDNEFTKTLEPQYRQSVLRTLLEDCLKQATKDEPHLIVVEDLHWIDALSHDLLEALARALTDSPICFVLAYRPPQLMRLQAPRLEAMPCFTKIELDELNLAEGEQAIRAKLAQLYPSRTSAVSPLLVEKLMARSQGNPFYLEELLNYVRDRGLDPANLDKIELPDSLHTLILSRIDTLAESEKATLRVASIIGRLFRADWLMGYYPELGELPRVKHDLEQLAVMDITPLDSPEPELAYLFKHIVTHEVTYENLPFATRAKLHEQLANYLENTDAPVDTIAFHYGRSENKEKQHEYWLKAGDAAYEAFANDAALEYYGRLPPSNDPEEQADLNLKRAGAYYALGRLAEAREHLKLVLDGLGQSLPTRWGVGGVLFREIARQVWHRLWFARRPIVADNDTERPPMSTAQLKLPRAYLLLGFVDTFAGTSNIVDVFTILRALNLTEAARQSSPELAQSYSSVGYTFGILSLHSLAQAYFQRAHAALAGLENLPIVSWVLLSANAYAVSVGDWEAAERGFVRALEICDRLGDRGNWVLNRTNQAWSLGLQGQFSRSLELYTDVQQEGLASHHPELQLYRLWGQAWVFLQEGQTARSIAIAESALSITLDSHMHPAEIGAHSVLASAYLRQGQFTQARQAAATASALLAQASLPQYGHVVCYYSIAEVYLALWEKEKTQNTAAELRALARQACRSLHQTARIFPFGQPGAWLWQGTYDWLDGKPSRARRAWQMSLLAAQKLAMPYDEALAYHEIGRHATGAERETNLARANEIFERLGVVGFGTSASAGD